jgi:glucuronoarabinoxylan endo-1,4-beta-xylanase
MCAIERDSLIDFRVSGNRGLVPVRRREAGVPPRKRSVRGAMMKVSSVYVTLWVGFAAAACASSSQQGADGAGAGTTGVSGGSAHAGSSGSGTGGTTVTGGTGAGATSGAAGSVTGGAGTSGSTSTGGSVGAGGGGTAGSAGAGGSMNTGGSAGAGGAFMGNKQPGTAQAGDITVDPGKTHQVVDGFGEADVWQGSSSTAMQTLLFDPVKGIGLTLLRIGIESVSGKSVLMGNAGIADGQAITKFGGKVWAAPWSPPASMKNNNNVNGTGKNTNLSGTNDTLKTSSYEAWASLLAAFPAYYKQLSGVDLYAISAQNEPDFDPNYEACVYDKTQMVNFIDVLGPKLAALNPPVKVLAAEPDNWGNLWGGDAYGPAIIADSGANMYVGPIATHDYGGTSAGTYSRPAPPANNTHHIWETECTPGDTGAITTATMIYAAFAGGNVSAWHYWWTQSFVPDVNNPPPQVYAVGNFSRFVRPGYYRVDVSGAPTPSGTNPLVVAFGNTADGTVSIVVVNGGPAKDVSFFVAGSAWPASVTPYVTSASSKLAAGTPISLTGARFTASLAAQSVTTFTGKP